jgi:hypothetical protein
MCLVGLLLFGVPFVFYMAGQIASWMMAMMKPARVNDNIVFDFLFMGIFILMQLLQALSQWYFALGSIRQCLYLARGGTGFQANQMFPPFMMFLKVSGFILLVFCITLPVLLPIAAIVGVTVFGVGHNVFANPAADHWTVPLTVAAFLVFIASLCVLMWIHVRLFLGQMFIADRNAGVVDSIKYAWRVSSGNFWMLLLSVLILAILTMMGYILCCVGVVFTVAIFSLGTTLAYLQLTGQPNCLDFPPLPPLHDVNENREWEEAQEGNEEQGSEERGTG